MRAEIALAAGDLVSAFENVQRALNGRRTIRGLKMRALIFQKMGDFDRGLADYEEALRMLPENHSEVQSILVNMGNLEFAAKRYPEAARQYLKAFELHPSGNIHPLEQAAESLALAGNRQTAMEVNRSSFLPNPTKYPTPEKSTLILAKKNKSITHRYGCFK